MPLRASRLLTVLALLALSIATIGVGSPAQAASKPSLRLRPNDGPAGITVTATGKRFASGSDGEVVWQADGSVLATFTANDNGAFVVKISIPNAAPGTYTVLARSGDREATDEFEVTAPETPTPSPTPTPTFAATVEASPDATPDASPVAAPVVTPPAAGAPSPRLVEVDCNGPAGRRIEVHNAKELEAALADARPGDAIKMADGVYRGTFTIATSGASNARITLCGSRDAVIDGGDTGNGYALHVTADYWIISGFTVTNALKGIMLDDADFDVLDHLTVHEIGHEGVHFRTNSADNVIQSSDVYDTGRKKAKFGEGIYLGSAVSNWNEITGGGPDQSDRNTVLNNRIWNTTAECIDIKEGTTGGVIEGNSFDGSALTGADSWVDVKGNSYLIQRNIGVNSPQDGFQTHVIDDLDWGRDNLFNTNTATVHGAGYGFYVHEPETSNNAVSCDNVVDDAAAGFANLPCTG